MLCKDGRRHPGLPRCSQHRQLSTVNKGLNMTTAWITTSAFALMGVLALGSPVMAQETGRVISSTPLVQQVGVPRQVCTHQPMAFSEPKSGAGAVMGAIAGGGLGNAVGQGGGKALATAIGVIGGAMAGNSIEGSNTQVQNVQQCSTQTFYENRTVGYNVVYEYGGKQYNVQMPNDPGPTLQLQVSPVGAMNNAPQTALSPSTEQPVTYLQPEMQQPVITNSTTYVVPAYPAYQPYYAPPVVYPRYYGGYYPPVGISLGFGYRGGYRGGYHGGHRR